MNEVINEVIAAEAEPVPKNLRVTYEAVNNVVMCVLNLTAHPPLDPQELVS